MKELTMLKTVMRNCVLLSLLAMLLPSVSLAQQYYDPSLLQKTIDSKPVGYQPVGARVGSFDLNPGAELTFEDNNNIFYLDTLKVSDNILHARPWLNANSDWSRHELNFNFYADLAKYDEWDDQSYHDYVGSLDGRVDVKRGSNFNYKVSYMSLHEDRSSPDGRGGIEPTEFTYRNFNIGYSHTFNRLMASLNFDFTDTDYDNNVDIFGTLLDNQDRNRSRDQLQLRFGYEMSARGSMFVSLASNTVDYDQQFDRAGFQRSSDGYSVQAGIVWDMTGVLVGSTYLEYIDQEYDDPAFNNVDGFGIGASLEWTPTKLTSVNIRVSNAPQETTQVNSSGYYSSLYAIRLQHELRRNWLFHVRASYTDNDYGLINVEPDPFDLDAGPLIETKVTRAGLGLSYLFNRSFYISGGYVFEEQEANLTRFDYKTRRLFLTIGIEF